MTPDEQDIVDRTKVALAQCQTQKQIDSVLDRAFEKLSPDAATANTLVVQMVAKRRKELKRD